MKILSFFMFYALATAYPSNKTPLTITNDDTIISGETNSSEIQATNTCNANLPQTTEELLNRLLLYVKDVVENGQEVLGIPPLEPLKIDSYILVIPTGLLFLNLNLKDITGSGFSDFILHEYKMDARSLTFDVDLEFPSLHITADEYSLLGYLYKFIPLYGMGRAEFHIKGFRLQARLRLGQSEDGKSVLIKHVENTSYIIPHMKSNLTGVIGGGDVDAIVNALIEDVFLDYINRFHGGISIIASQASMTTGNNLLQQLNTWCYIDALQY